MNSVRKAAASLATAADELGLSSSERAVVAELERVARSTYPGEYAQLVELADDPKVDERYNELAVQVPDLLREEMSWLADLVRQALAETDGQAPWVILYFTLARRSVLCRKLEHRLNPRAEVVMPSPFVYAMQ